MCAVRCEDYNEWEELGARGWGYADVLPYFKRMENSHGGEDGWRGTDGPLHVRRGSVKNPLFKAFVEAGEQAGFELTEDYNGYKQEGFGLMEQTMHNGRRWSAAIRLSETRDEARRMWNSCAAMRARSSSRTAAPPASRSSAAARSRWSRPTAR